MPSKRTKRGPQSRKSDKRKKSAGRKRGNPTKPTDKTNEPFEQDPKRRIGQHSGTGTPPLMKN
jgi:hypothetical protein